jgi:PilZ domain
MGNFSPAIERRLFGRRQDRLLAVINARSRSSIPCIVQDMSDGGALLEVAQPSLLPLRFQVLIEATGRAADCEIVHRTDTTVGVRFLAAIRPNGRTLTGRG